MKNTEYFKISIFEELWQTVKDNFYDSDFIGRNWQKMREKYKVQIKHIGYPEEFSFIINQMLSELNASHTNFFTSLDPEYYDLLSVFSIDPNQKQLQRFFSHGEIECTGIGIKTKIIEGKTFVSSVLDGSPAELASIRVGDQILAVDGAPFHPILSFLSKESRAVKIRIQKEFNLNKVECVPVIPTRVNPRLNFWNAMKASTKIFSVCGLKIGYIHIWSYAGEEYQHLLVNELIHGKLSEADGIILDIRNGLGGANPDYLSIFTEKIIDLGSDFSIADKAAPSCLWSKPVALMVNEETRSGKEVFAYGFKKYKIGPIIGNQTAGAVLKGRPFLLQDGSLLYLAVENVWVDGERLEGKGVLPDIFVPFPMEYAQGKDPQIEKAVEMLVQMINQ